MREARYMGRSIARRAAPAVFCVLAFFALACASDEEKLAEHLERAAEYREEGARPEELLELRAALQLDPQSAEINRLIARAYDALGRPAEANFYFGEAYRLDPSLTSAALAQVPGLSGTDPDAADALIDEVLEREPDNARAYARRAEMALVRVDTEAALQAALTAVELAPEDPLTHRVLGTVYRAIIREKGLRRQEPEDSLYEAAIAAFDRAEALPTEEVARGSWFDRKEKAFVYGTWPGHQEEAKQAFREAFELARAEDQARGMREVADQALRDADALGLGDAEFFRWALERRLEVAPGDVRAWQRLAQVARNAGEPWEAVWQRALEERPDQLSIHLAYALELARADRRDEAISHLEKLPAELAEQPGVPASLVELNLDVGRTDAAREALARLRERHEEHVLTQLSSARLDFHEGRVAEAAETLRRLSGEVERADVFRLLALGELRLGDARAALAAADRSLELDRAATPELFRIRMQAQALLSDWQAVLTTHREMITRRITLSRRDRLTLARALYATGQDEEARKNMISFLMNPEKEIDFVLLFAEYEMDRNPVRVQKLLEKSLAHHPENGALLRALAHLDVSEGHPERALQRIEARGSGESLPPGLRLLRAKLLAGLGRVEEAEREALAVFETDPNRPESADLLVRILEAQGKRAEAIAHLEEAREKGTLLPRQLWLLARLHLDSGDLARSREPLEAALRRAPQLQVVRNDLAYVLAKTGEELDRAVDLAREAKAAFPESPAVADTLGYVYYRRGLLDPAVGEFRFAIDRAKAGGEVPPDFHYHLGLALQALGQNDEAIRQFDAALAIQPEHEGAKDARREISSSTEAGADS